MLWTVPGEQPPVRGEDCRLSSDSELYHYQQHYRAMQFERAGLLRALQATFPVTTVLYPGCFIHITPSFYFPHVVYVDNDPAAETFFSGTGDLLEFINRNKTFKRSAYLAFLCLDYTEPLPLQEGSFDLLLSLYAPGVALACRPYLASNGLLVTNNHQDDAGQAAREGYILSGVIHQKGDQVSLSTEDLESYLIPKKTMVGKQPPGTQVSRWPEYTRNADYYLFRNAR